MPTVSAFFSGGVSVGILAGVVSGLFYLVVAGFRWAGRLRAARLREAQRQLQRRRDRERALRKDWAAGFDGDVGGGGRRVAVAAAAMAGEEEERREDGWREVKQHSGEWLYRQVQRRLHPVCEDNCLCSAENGVGMEPKTVQVREFIERLVESLVAGELDNVCIKRLHTHSEYERMFACHHAPLCEALARLSFALQMAIANKYMAGQDSPSAAHAALKQLIHQIIQEAMALPKFKGTRPIEDDVKTMEEMSSKTYEDILATAILNKVIERYQQSDSSRRGSMDGNSNMLSPELMSLIAMHQPQLLHATDSEQQSPKELSDQRFFANDTDTLSELSNTDPLSVTIEECIEEVTTFSNAEEDDDDDDADSGVPGLSVFKKRRAQFPEYGRDIIDGPPLNLSHNGDDDEDDDGEESEEESSLNPTDIINPVDSWEENWLFQKRRLKVGGVQQPMPVPMLVPNPSEDFRALIGDRDAEDVSDLSDCSDGALEDVVHAAEPPAKPAEVLPTSDLDNEESQSVEGSVDGSNLSALEQSGKEPERRSGAIGNPVIVLSEADTDQEIPLEIPDFPEAKNMEFLKSASEDCLSEFGQQEGEYTEDYATVTHQRQMDSLTGMSDVDTQEVPELPSTPIPQVSPETSAADGSIASILDSVVPEDALPQEFSSTDQQERELVKPPRPGTIAEREHKKWETAAPLPNNPYSPENIIKRLNKKHTFVRTNSGSDGSSELPELKDTEVEEKIVEKPLQVICSPSDVDYKRYGRDYYINAEHSSNEKKKRTTSVSSDSQVSDATRLSVAKLEKQILNRDVYHSSFRARNASSHFIMNPLYETDRENIQSLEDKDNIHSMFQDDQCDPDNATLYCTSDMSATFKRKTPVHENSSVRTNPLFEYSPNENVDNPVSFPSPPHTFFENFIASQEDILEGRVPSQERFALRLGRRYQNSQRKDNYYNESGYSSSLDSLHDPSSVLLRLTPPTQPQMVERSFESLSSIRRSGSLRVGPRKRKAILSPVIGGSLRICRRTHESAKDLW